MKGSIIVKIRVTYFIDGFSSTSSAVVILHGVIYINVINVRIASLTKHHFGLATICPVLCGCSSKASENAYIAWDCCRLIQFKFSIYLQYLTLEIPRRQFAPSFFSCLCFLFEKYQVMGVLFNKATNICTACPIERLNYWGYRGFQSNFFIWLSSQSPLPKFPKFDWHRLSGPPTCTYILSNCWFEVWAENVNYSTSLNIPTFN